MLCVWLGGGTEILSCQSDFPCGVSSHLNVIGFVIVLLSPNLGRYISTHLIT